MPKATLTTTTVSHISCPAGKRKEMYFDTHTKGLVLEVRASGGKTYYIRYTDKRGKTRQIKLADAGDVTLTQARQLCVKARNKIAMGIDPNEEKAELRSVPTFKEFAEQQYLPFVKTYKRSWKTDESLLRIHLVPFFGKKHMDEITRDDIIRMIDVGKKSGARPGTVNRRIILTRYMFNLAIRDWQLPGLKKNPTEGIPLLIEDNRKERYVTEAEMAALYDAVCQSPNPMLRYVVAFLFLTGARRNEVLHAQWDDIDFAERRWHIPKTKSGYARYVPLNDGALAVLEQMQDLSRSDYIFANPKTGLPYQHIFAAWDTARKRAGLSHVRMHDLRHSFASFLINRGRSLYEVQKLLGHTQVKTTQRYAHLTQETLQAASNIGTASVAAIFLQQGQGQISGRI